jgi:hypothetical protein
MSVASGATPLCSGITGGVAECNVAGFAGANVTVTWSLSSAQTLNGYDLNVSWDPAELTLISADQLYPGSQAPNTIPFLVAPNPADPVGSEAVALSLIAYSTTPLFRATFQLADGPSLARDCTPDLTWSANGNGLAPASVVLGNPGGASIDLEIPRACSDGLDNDNDGKIDFDGGVCAGAPVPTAADPYCVTATRTREKQCGIGYEVAPALVLIALAGRRRARIARSS